MERVVMNGNKYGGDRDVPREVGGDDCWLIALMLQS